MSVSDLQRQCQELLSTLKKNQSALRQGLLPACQPASLENNMQGKFQERKPEYARQKLKSIMKQNSRSLDTITRNGDIAFHASQQAAELGYSELSESRMQQRPLDEEQTRGQVQSKGQEMSRLAHSEIGVKDKTAEKEALPDISGNDAIQEYFQSRVTDSLMEDGTDSITGVISTDDNTHPVPVAKATTPIMVRRRRIIDRNVHVNSKLSDAELRELEKGTSGLNFSYSNADETLLKASSQEETNVNQNASSVAPEEMGYTYTKQLVDTGNNRHLNNFVKETTIKPKTILNSTQFYSSVPGVSSQSSTNNSGNSSLFRSQAGERRLLGYDWIAALIDNTQGLMDESESYFHELREFRRCNRDECCNDFYMEGPFTLTETEPSAVDQALNDKKVQPYTVNERLFTTPVTENLLGEPMNPNRETQKDEPTEEYPRFVRVSIPRSTLLLPYKARPHRRRSFDSSDSCSLLDHCLMGWSTASPATLPTASSVALTDAIVGTNPKHTTTMAEAERVASTFQWPLLRDPRPKVDPLPTWRKQYMDTTINFPQPDLSLSLSSSLSGGARQRLGSLRQRTDELLNATYSMMYEMQRAKEQRTEEMTRNTGQAAA